ncbi:MAG: 16S rRNA (cytosine(1402)-N(4))-methyltransferase RsmH [Candidatus Spechtbacterales bacterium]
MSEANKRTHIPVLLNEVLDNFSPAPGERYIDCTAGEGGHSLAIAKLVAPDGGVLSIELDPLELEVFKEKIEDLGLEGVIEAVHGSFANIAEVAEKNDFVEPNGILFDLGFSSWQLERSDRGFTFQKNENLDMRFNPGDDARPTAAEIVNSYPKEDLEIIFTELGEESRARVAADAIVKARRKNKIMTTGDLVNVISSVIPGGGRINPATKIFQALRMEVNDELANIEKGIESAMSVVAPGGLIAVITFHSIEDRLVKQIFKKAVVDERGELVNKKVIKPEWKEVQENPRSRSAKLRIFRAM